MVPPNPIYGFRIPSTMSPEVWYLANRFAGVAMTIAAVVWLVAEVMLPPSREPLVIGIGLAALGLATACSFGRVYGRK
jgi:hypothetical protein